MTKPCLMSVEMVTGSVVGEPRKSIEYEGSLKKTNFLFKQVLFFYFMLEIKFVSLGL